MGEGGLPSSVEGDACLVLPRSFWRVLLGPVKEWVLVWTSKIGLIELII